MTNTVCTVPDKSVGGAGVAKGGDSGANTEVVRDSAAGRRFVQSAHLVSAECLLYVYFAVDVH